MELAKTNDLLGAALAYADLGKKVFPLKPRSKAPAVQGGFQAATTDQAQIRSWWIQRPNANLGIRTGRHSGLVVLDVDPRNGGDESFARLLADFELDLSETPTVDTGGGGVHYLFGHPGGEEIRCRAHIRGYGGVDLKADGGYIVAAPSLHPSGGRYGWREGLSLFEVDPPDTPSWLIELADGGIGPERENFESQTWDGKLPDQVAMAVGLFPKVGRRFHRDPAGLNDQSDSGIDFSLACLLARCGHEGSAIEAGIQTSRALAGLPPKGRSYFQATIGKALALQRRGSHDD